MLKKIISTIILLCLVFGINVTAENTNNQPVPEASVQSAQVSDEHSQDNGTPPAPSQNSGEFTTSQSNVPPQNNDANTGNQTSPPSNGNISPENSQAPVNNENFRGQMPGGMGGFPGNMQNTQNTEVQQPTGFLGFVKTYSTPITSVFLLIFAYIFVIFYKRKNY